MRAAAVTPAQIATRHITQPRTIMRYQRRLLRPLSRQRAAAVQWLITVMIAQAPAPDHPARLPQTPFAPHSGVSRPLLAPRSGSLLLALGRPAGSLEPAPQKRFAPSQPASNLPPPAPRSGLRAAGPLDPSSCSRPEPSGRPPASRFSGGPVAVPA